MEKGPVESSEVLLFERVRLDQRVLDGESGPVALPGDEFNSSVLMFVDPVTMGFTPSVRMCPESCRKASWRKAPADWLTTLPRYAA